MKNLTYLLVFSAALPVGLLGLLCAAEPKQDYTFENGRAADSLDHVVVQIDIGGELKEKGKEKTANIPLSEVHNLEYDEKTLELPSAAGGRWRSIRAYSKAEGVIKVGDDGAKPALRPQRSLVGVEVAGNHDPFLARRRANAGRTRHHRRRRQQSAARATAARGRRAAGPSVEALREAAGRPWCGSTQ